jgi:hypothetical protein
MKFVDVNFVNISSCQDTFFAKSEEGLLTLWIRDLILRNSSATHAYLWYLEFFTIEDGTDMLLETQVTNDVQILR